MRAHRQSYVQFDAHIGEKTLVLPIVCTRGDVWLLMTTSSSKERQQAADVVFDFGCIYTTDIR